MKTIELPQALKRGKLHISKLGYVIELLSSLKLRALIRNGRERRSYTVGSINC